MVEKIDYIDGETLFIPETTYILAFHSIASGYNTKSSISLENQYKTYFGNIDIVIIINIK